MAEKFVMPCIIEDGVEETLYTFAKKHKYVPLMIRFYGEKYLLKNNICDTTTIARHTTIDTGEEFVRVVLIDANMESDLLGNFTSEAGDNYVCFWCQKPCDPTGMHIDDFVKWYNDEVQKLCTVFERYNWCMQEIETGVYFEEFLQFLTNAFELVSKEKLGNPISLDFREVNGKVIVDMYQCHLVEIANDFEYVAATLYFKAEGNYEELFSKVKDSPMWDGDLFLDLKDPTMKCIYWSAVYKSMKLQECLNLANDWLKALGLQEDED